MAKKGKKKKKTKTSGKAPTAASPASGGDLRPFVIMLDHLLEVLPGHWPISEQAATLESARLKRQHRGNPLVLARSQYEMRLIENKALIDAETGRVDHGGIYRAEEVQ